VSIGAFILEHLP